MAYLGVFWHKRKNNLGKLRFDPLFNEPESLHPSASSIFLDLDHDQVLNRSQRIDRRKRDV